MNTGRKEIVSKPDDVDYPFAEYPGVGILNFQVVTTSIPVNCSGSKWTFDSVRRVK